MHRHVIILSTTMAAISTEKNIISASNQPLVGLVMALALRQYVFG
jgi:hypothetical protein